MDVYNKYTIGDHDSSGSDLEFNRKLYRTDAGAELAIGDKSMLKLENYSRRTVKS